MKPLVLSRSMKINSEIVKIVEGIIVSKLLRATPAKYDRITSSMKKFGDLDTMTLNEPLEILVFNFVFNLFAFKNFYLICSLISSPG